MTRFSVASKPSKESTQDSSIALLSLIMASSVPAALRAAVQLDVADHLKDGPLAIEDLASATHTQALHLQRIMRVLCAYGVFREQPVNTYQLDQLGQHLRTDASARLKDATLMLTDPALLYGVRDLARAAAGSPIFREHFGHGFFEHWEDRSIHSIFHQGISEKSMASNRLLIEKIDIPQGARVVDVGGGIGRLLSLVLQQHPSAYGVLYDHAQVLENSVLADLNQADRWEHVAGDFFESCPEGDVYLLQNVLHDWSDEQSIRILRNCKQGMSKQGRVLVLEAVIQPDNRPNGGKLLDLVVMGVLENSRERTQAEFESLFAHAGLRLIRHIDCGGVCSILELEHA